MNPKFLKAMKAKKKRVMDPNIPRPNLFSHDKEIRGIKTANETVAQQITHLQDQVRKLERKVQAQADYIGALNQRVVLKK
jgi:hypothetical protein